MEYQDIWDGVLDQLRNSVPTPTFNVFFKESHIEDIKENDEGYVVVIPVPHQPAMSTFMKHTQLITQLFSGLFDAPCELEIVIRKKEDSDKEAETQNKTAIEKFEKPKTGALERLGKIKEQIDSRKKTSSGAKGDEMENSPLFSHETEKIVRQRHQDNNLKLAIRRSNLDPEYTFENFAVSPTNEVAFAGATAVAKSPGKTYNPFFIYGDVGVGKTHLMQAAGIRLLMEDPRRNLVYSVGEQFTNGIIEAIQMKKTPQFRSKYRKVDVLLIDDIQFIAGKDFVQEEFFHTFNAIKSAGGQVIMTADKPPHEITYLEDRLRSRFEEGLAIDIQAPNFELRTAILLIKSKQMGMNLPMTGAQLIAQGVTSTRKLEGFLKQLYATTTLMHRQISPEAISEQLRKMGNEDIVKSKRPYTRPIEILKVISKHFNVTESQIIGPKRLRPIVIPRQYAMYLMRVDLEISYKEIGRILGGRDHTTVMYAVEKISKEVNLSEVKQQEISTLRKQIYG